LCYLNGFGVELVVVAVKYYEKDIFLIKERLIMDYGLHGITSENILCVRFLKQIYLERVVG